MRHRAHPLPAGAQRLPPYWPCQEHPSELRPGPEVPRQVQHALRRHQPHQGRHRVRGVHQGGHPVAGGGLGGQAVLRLRLFRPDVRGGGEADQEGQGLCVRPDRGADSRIPGKPHRAGQGRPLQYPHRGGEPAPVPGDEGREVRRRREGAAGPHRHGLAQHQHARPRHLSRGAHESSQYRRRLVHLSHV